MAPRSPDALINPELLTWARENAGFSVEEAAHKVRVKPERLQQWESGERNPTVKQLRELGRVYKRPIAVFYLPEPPKDFQPIHDFRHLPGQASEQLSPELRYEMRVAQNRRELAIELFEAIGGSEPPTPFEVNLSDEPEEVGKRIRNFLNVSHEEKSDIGPGYPSFNFWRSKFEEAGILVFQAKDVDITEMRGFSISDIPFPVVVVNLKDTVNGRIFSMLHELSHILLRQGGVCLFEEGSGKQPDDEVEVFCNYVAGASLVPQDHLLNEESVKRSNKRTNWSDEEIGWLANRYGVSRETLLRRLLICNRTTKRFYEQKREQFKEEYLREHRKKEKGGFAPPYRMTISRSGPFFTNLVIENYHQENITPSDLSDYLGVRLKHLNRIEEELDKKAVSSSEA